MDLRFGRARYEPPPESWRATIARVETYVASSAAAAASSKSPAVVVAVTTSDGIVGHGQIGSKDPGAALDLLWRHCVPAVLGRPLRDPFALVERMLLRHGLNYKRHGMAFNGAVAGIDAAVWDAVGKRQGVPVCELFRGGKARPLPLYASSISRTAPPDRLAKALHRLHRAFGVCRFKVKIGTRMRSTARDDPRPGATFSAIEAAFGSGGSAELSASCSSCSSASSSSSPADSSGEPPAAVRIAVDANGAFDDPAIAADAVHALASRPGMQTPRASFWFAEEPVPWMEYGKCNAVRRDLAARRGGARPVTIAGGEQEFRLDVWRRLLLSPTGSDGDAEGGESGGSAPFTLAQPDVGYCGGFSVAMAIAEMAVDCSRSPRIRIAPHSPQPDFHTVWAQHLLSSGVGSAFEYLEVACVEDGLSQMVFEEILPREQTGAGDDEALVPAAVPTAFFSTSSNGVDC